ncbi:hypothetical protein B0H12DRAFT_1211246 [Mycena haematopus]|nr:hypothetical protein B0H12DRAFT_1211246 [Mycena haematopus]
MDRATRARLAQQYHGDGGRTLSELLKTKEILKGAESQRLRTFCTSECMELSRDLDAYGIALAKGDLAHIKADFASRVARHSALASEAPPEESTTSDPSTKPEPESAAAQELYELTWGPTRVSIYGLLGLMRIISPERAADHLAVARFLINTAKVPVNGPDLSGTLALSHAISTKPAQDFEYAQLLYDAGGDVNNRNRYGDIFVVMRATESLRWFLDHNGSVDIADSDGMTVRRMMMNLQRFAPGLDALVVASDRERKARAKGEGCCALCGRVTDETMKRCGRCKVAHYCDPDVRQCQKIDWPHHKKGCIKAAT